MGAGRFEERRASKLGLFRWAMVVCAVTIVVAIGGPLIGRGTFIGTSIVRTVLPWRMNTSSNFEYRLPPVYDTVEIGAPERILIRDTLVNDHRVALWDPFANGGTPLGSQPNTGIFAPLSWPLLLLGVRLGAAWAGLLRLAVAAAGAVLPAPAARALPLSPRCVGDSSTARAASSSRGTTGRRRTWRR